MNKIFPSVMCIDIMDIKNEIMALDNARVDSYHIDIMDGHFVPNFCLNGYIIQDIKKVSNTPVDVHLMITNPSEYIKYFSDCGADIITLHIETLFHPIRAFKEIRLLGKKSGVAINPATEIGNLAYILDFVDLVCIMTVDPGFSGQTYIPSTIDKIKKVREMVNSTGKDIDIMVDGQVKNDTVQKFVNAGANALVLGSSGLFKYNRKEYSQIIDMYKNIGNSTNYQKIK